MNIIVTGASGYVGSELIGKLIGHRIYACIHKNPIEKTKFIVPVYVNLLDYNSMSGEFDGVDIDIIIHLAQSNASDQIEKFYFNVFSTLNVLKLALDKHVKKLIFASGGNAYGNQAVKCGENTAKNPADLYGLSKSVCEDMLLMHKDSFRLNILRIYTVIGLADNGRLVARLFKSIENGDEIVLNGEKGYPYLSFIGLYNLVNIIKFMVEDDVDLPILNVAADGVFSIKEISERIGRLLNKSVRYSIQSERKMTMIADNSLLKSFYKKELLKLDDVLLAYAKNNYGLKRGNYGCACMPEM